MLLLFAATHTPWSLRTERRGVCMQDPNEVNDLAATNPAMLSTMAKRLAAIRDTTYAPARGALDPAACVANDKAGGYWSPWLTLHH